MKKEPLEPPYSFRMTKDLRQWLDQQADGRPINFVIMRILQEAKDKDGQ